MSYSTSSTFLLCDCSFADLIYPVFAASLRLGQMGVGGLRVPSTPFLRPRLPTRRFESPVRALYLPLRCSFVCLDAPMRRLGNGVAIEAPLFLFFGDSRVERQSL